MHVTNSRDLFYAAIFCFCSVLTYFGRSPKRFKFARPLGFMLMALGFLILAFTGNLLSLAPAILGVVLMYGAALFTFLEDRKRK